MHACLGLDAVELRLLCRLSFRQDFQGGLNLVFNNQIGPCDRCFQLADPSVQLIKLADSKLLQSRQLLQNSALAFF